jgi:hypothetical protein
MLDNKGDNKMAVAEKRNKDAAMARYMHEHPGSFPDSIKRPGQGQGAADRKLAMTMGFVRNDGSKWQIAMLGGILAAKLGYSSNGIPDELLNSSNDG